MRSIGTDRWPFMNGWRSAGNWALINSRVTRRRTKSRPRNLRSRQRLRFRQNQALCRCHQPGTRSHQYACRGYGAGRAGRCDHGDRKKYGAKVTQIIGNDLLKKNYPAVHTVGRASSRPPRLIDLSWGNPKHPHIALVGKGVCFDTGGLDLKPSSNMYQMKKDMAGAACALAVAQMVMDAKLPVYLRLLVPAVENSVSGNAFRPTDVIRMRSGLTVEVGNTDAEGRLILADALAEAAAKKPAPRYRFFDADGCCAYRGRHGNLRRFSAMTIKWPPHFCRPGHDMEDPVWRLPLHAPYKKMLESPVADLNSAPNSPYAGAVTAALFLGTIRARRQSLGASRLSWRGTAPASPAGPKAARPWAYAPPIV